MKRSTAWALLAITLLAVLMRLLPLLRSLYWGSDFGEYLALTRSLAQDGVLPSAYRGWGITYPYFPGLYVVDGAFVLAGMPADAAATFIVPVLAGLAILPMFLLVVRVTGDDLAGLVAAAFLAVVMPHVYPTSHAIPAALGDTIVLAALLMYVGLRRTPRLFVPLLLAGFAVVVTHHLSTYFLLLAATAALLLRAVLDSKLTVRAIRYELAFVAILLVAALGFWAWGAPPLWSLIVRESSVPVPALLAVAAFAVGLAPIVILLRKRTAWRFRPRVRTVRGAAIAAGAALASCLVILILFASVPVLGTTIRIDRGIILPLVPVLAFMSVSAAGRKALDFSRAGPDVTAWFVAFVASIVLGALTASAVLIPYRHIEYVAIPLGVMVGAGWRWLSLGARGRTAGFAVAAAAVVLVAGSAASAYPPPNALAGFQEGISDRTAEAALWVRTQAHGLVAGDHRLSTVLFGIGGVDATWDRAGDLWHAGNATAVLDAIDDVRVLGSVTSVSWVVLDDDLRAGVQTSPFEPALPLTAGEAAVFATTPFQKMFDSGFAQAYYVNWGLAP